MRGPVGVCLARMEEERAAHGVGGRQASFCVPAVAAIPPDIEDVKAIPYLLNPYVGARSADLVSNSKIDNNGGATE
jgi:hypothetical protein